MINIQTFTFNPFQENTYVLYDETKECIIVDPGCYERQEKDELVSFIEINNLKVVKLINTHCHVDHVLGNKFIKEYFKVDLYIHPLDEPILRAVKVYAPNYGFFQYEETEPDKFLVENEEIEFGNSSLKVIFTPGHAPGHVTLYSQEGKFCISGDVLFYRSIGRTDLPGGNYNTLIESIHNKIFPLGNDIKIYPGHGPATLIEDEKKHNPFCGLKA